jgi:hypothetical protein
VNKNQGWSIDHSVRQYSQFLIDKIHGYEPAYMDYSRLILYLFDSPYKFYGSDEDRYRDGIGLRYIYAQASGDYVILDWDVGCTVLEMLVALAQRLDSDIMGQPDIDETYYWFWLFIDNLHLRKFTDDRFDEYQVRYIIEDWLNNRITFNGDGGLFPLKCPVRNQSSLPVWQQMSDYLKENYHF